MSSYLSHRRKGFQGGVTAFDGFGNRSRSFDGTSDIVTIPASLGAIFTTGDFSISQWFKVEQGVNDFAYMLAEGGDSASQNKGFGTGIINGQVYGFIHDGVRLNFTRTGGVYNDGQWHHRVDNFDRDGNWSCYVDGVLDASQDISARSSTITNGHDTNIGMYISSPINGGGYYEGKLSDVRAYDSLLSIGDISDLYAGTDVQTNLVAHYLTDADNVLDNAGSNNGTNYGSKYSYDNPSPPVEFGRASRSFDGVDDTINLGQTTDNAIFSVSSWFKLNTVNSNGSGIIGKWHGNASASWLLYVRSASASGNMTFIVRNGADTGHSILDSGVSASSLIGEWTHIASVADGNNLTMYINGVSVASTSYDGTIHNLAADAHIGSYNADVDNNHRTNANIADCRIYDTDLTASQISDLYDGTDVQTNLIGHWLTDNDDVEDKAGTNDGTNFGSTYSYDNPPMDLVPSRQASRNFALGNLINMGDVDGTAWQGANKRFSVSCWAKMTGGDAARVLAGKLAGSQLEWLFASLSSGAVRFVAYGSLTATSYVFGDTPTSTMNTTWKHFTATFDGTQADADKIKIYVDGSLPTLSHTTVGTNIEIQNGTAGLTIGSQAGYFNRFVGNIADVRIYDTNLTASQVLDIYNGTTDRTNLIGQWLTNSDDVLDHAGTNDGTNNGSTYSTDSPS